MLLLWAKTKGVYMKKLLLQMAIAITLVSSPLMMNKSQALVGYYLNNKSINTIAGITLTGSFAGFFGSIVLGGAKCATGWCVPVKSLAGTIIRSSLVLSIIGIVILDDDSAANLEFSAISEDSKAYSLEAIRAYNDELPLINSVRETILSEIKDNSFDAKLSKKLWLEYSKYVSEDTFHIARDQAEKFIKEFHKNI